MLRLVTLALMMVVSRCSTEGGGGCEGGCEGSGEATGASGPSTEGTGHATAGSGPSTEGTGPSTQHCGHTGHTGECNSTQHSNICQNDTNCTQHSSANDTHCTEGTCGSDGPQMHADFGYMNCGPSDSNGNPTCSDRYNGFVYQDPLWNSDVIAFGQPGYVAPAQPAASRGGSSSQGATRPDWETHEWTCSACTWVNSPVYNPTHCEMCDTERPEQEQPAAAPAPAGVDPLTIESLPADENDTEKKNTCCICMDRVSDIVLLGAKQGGEYTCRHKCMCRQCAHKMRQSGNAKCPMCRTKVEHFAVVDAMPKHMQNRIFN